MPVISSSTGLVVLAALLPIAVAPVILSPNEVAGYTFAGAAVAAFLSVAYMRIKAPSRVSFWPLAFTVVSALVVGWLIPEPLAWWAVRAGKVTAAEVETLPRQLWAAAGLFWGLSGTTLILTAIYWIQNKLPGKVTNEEIVAVPLQGGGQLEIKHTKPADTAGKA